MSKETNLPAIYAGKTPSVSQHELKSYKSHKRLSSLSRLGDRLLHASLTLTCLCALLSYVTLHEWRQRRRGR